MNVANENIINLSDETLTEGDVVEMFGLDLDAVSLAGVVANPTRWDASMDSLELVEANNAGINPSGGMFEAALLRIYADGSQVLVNGMHRLAAHREHGESVMMVTVEVMDDEGYTFTFEGVPALVA